MDRGQNILIIDPIDAIHTNLLGISRIEKVNM